MDGPDSLLGHTQDLPGLGMMKLSQPMLAPRHSLFEACFLAFYFSFSFPVMYVLFFFCVLPPRSGFLGKEMGDVQACGVRDGGGERRVPFVMVCV